MAVGSLFRLAYSTVPCHNKGHKLSPTADPNLVRNSQELGLCELFRLFPFFELYWIGYHCYGQRRGH